MPHLLATIPAAPVVALMAMGVVIAVVGHATRDRRLQALGIGLLFVATALMVLLGYLSYENGDGDPRKLNDPRSPNL